MKETEKLLKEFEVKFGFKTWEYLKLRLLSPMYQKISDLTTSRDNWKNKYMELKYDRKKM